MHPSGDRCFELYMFGTDMWIRATSKRSIEVVA